jgi:hypothetical protein
VWIKTLKTGLSRKPLWLETDSTTSVGEQGSGCLSSDGAVSAEQKELGVLEDGTNHFGGAGQNWGLVWRPDRFGDFGAAREIMLL